MITRTLRLIIRGQVQGVGFRYFVLRQAVELELKGWVRNLPDSSLEIEINGEETNMELFILRCMEGPPMARVSEVHRQELPAGSYTGFRIR